MSVKTAVKQPEIRPSVDSAAQAERREGLRRAQHENWLEGIEPNPAYDHICEAYVRGDITASQMIDRANQQDGIPSREEALRRIRAGEKVPGYS
jgi:hypothetical protein